MVDAPSDFHVSCYHEVQPTNDLLLFACSCKPNLLLMTTRTYDTHILDCYFPPIRDNVRREQAARLQNS